MDDSNDSKRHEMLNETAIKALSSDRPDGKVSRRCIFSMFAGFGLFGGCATDNSKKSPLIYTPRDTFEVNYETCLGVPLARFTNKSINSFDGSVIELRIAQPAIMAAKTPIIVGCIDDNAELVNYDLMIGALAAKGFLVIGMKPSLGQKSKIFDLTEQLNIRRAQQLSYVLDHLAIVLDFLGSDIAMLNHANIGVAGHGAGAWTALQLVGWGRDLTPSNDLVDARIKAAFALMPTSINITSKDDDVLPSAKVIYGRTMIAGNLSDVPNPPTGSGVLGLGLPSKSIGFGGLLGIKQSKNSEKPQREVLAASCTAAGFFFDWSLRGNKDAYNQLVALNGREIPQIGKKLTLVKA